MDKKKVPVPAFEKDGGLVRQTETSACAPPDSGLHMAARAYFPRGLRQPRDGYRFSADTLLLGSFLHPKPRARILDLGTGCAAAALTMLCRYPSLSVTGVDIQPEYLVMAKENAALLGFGEMFTALCADVAAPGFPRQGGSFDGVIANPPYRKRDRGKLPPSPSRLLALFEKPETLTAFCGCAFRALRPGGSFGVIFPADRRDELLAHLRAACLMPLRLMRVSSHEGAKPRVLLVEAVKHTKNSTYRKCIEECSIFLHTTKEESKKHPKDRTFSVEALRFCPFLAKNAGYAPP